MRIIWLCYLIKKTKLSVGVPQTVHAGQSNSPIVILYILFTASVQAWFYFSVYLGQPSWVWSIFFYSFTFDWILFFISHLKLHCRNRYETEWQFLTCKRQIRPQKQWKCNFLIFWTPMESSPCSCSSDSCWSVRVPAWRRSGSGGDSIHLPLTMFF